MSFWDNLAILTVLTDKEYNTTIINQNFLRKKNSSLKLVSYLIYNVWWLVNGVRQKRRDENCDGDFLRELVHGARLKFNLQGCGLQGPPFLWELVMPSTPLIEVESSQTWSEHLGSPARSSAVTWCMARGLQHWLELVPIPSLVAAIFFFFWGA